MLNSRATVSIGALSGGNNLATALSLNACPYLATSFFHYRPFFQDSIEATTILTQGVPWRASFGGRHAAYALELPAGCLARLGVRPGDRLDHPLFAGACRPPSSAPSSSD